MGDRPVHALTWIEREGKFLRSIALYDLRFVHLEREPGECTWCGGTIGDDTRRTRYCGDECRNEAWVRCVPSATRDAVHRRDRGVCAECGIDTDEIRRLEHKWSMRLSCRTRRCWKDGRVNRRGSANWRRCRNYRRKVEVPGERHERTVFQHWKHRKGFPLYGSLWEMDHIVPVSEGGGLCGLDNLRTLCVPCHRDKTAALAAKQAEAARGLQRLPGMEIAL